MYKTMREPIKKMRTRKGTMYRSADSGKSDPLPPVVKNEVIPTLTPQEQKRTNPFANLSESDD
jgi:hypothetical protein